MKKIILTTAAVAVLASSSALAIENDFFVKVNAGYSKMNKVKGAKAKNDMFFGIGAGYYVMDNVRADLTFDHFVNPTFKKGGKKIKGEVNTLLLNGFIDLFDISIAKVFVGAGIGGSQVKAKVTGDAVAANNGKAKQKYNLAYAAYLGSSVEFAPGITGEVTYSYRAMGKTKEINKVEYEFKGHNVGAGVRFDL
ncbi:MAG: outer membrane beta-barrel protein [Rickettsiaceae bacterium]|nr:outer membrane beta-barrel protein [Rickettsiaceae bacterium]MDP5020862.1 outer membrane beta-barrel protein [Rickettsiaceae bacterium]MDP5083292.1 outer membrane beta-barrel protein [Rickettsiaceae bacterium]